MEMHLNWLGNHGPLTKGKRRGGGRCFTKKKGSHLLVLARKGRERVAGQVREKGEKSGVPSGLESWTSV